MLLGGSAAPIRPRRPLCSGRASSELAGFHPSKMASTNKLTLQDIFQFYITQLTLNLKPPSNLIRPLQPSRTKSNEASQTQSQPQASQRVTEVPYYNEYCYLLDSLATIKSIVLACDVPGGDEIVTDFFSGFIDIVRYVGSIQAPRLEITDL